ncbi:hypothetical protein UFOVP1266_11 [uncultured Caudovirales phage]|uniref:Uncharacterized protein n=1 Tax=uncultured Caudovirales phage TaxID=2100421 RepID=A0A6J5RKW0_9CAUD|nr:hypothetical protein UFOVP876_11 [uncultured Caudovirales phage]CAB4194926.1 hypothetical protein UFOVP1266_11 [uncultured Caudovirales phage]
MTLFLNVELEGTTEILAELRKIDETLHSAALSQIKSALGPMVQGARGFIPTTAPVSGMARGYFMWDGDEQRSSVKAKVAKKRKGQTKRLATISLTNSAAALFDMAGKGSGNTQSGRNLIAGITRRYGPPSRAMWKAQAIYMRLTEQSLLEARRQMETDLNRLLGG